MGKHEECLVKRKAPGYSMLVKGALIAICILLLCSAFLFVESWFLIAAAVMIVVSIWVFKYYNMEFEYEYIDKELSIDRILDVSYRSHMATFDFNTLLCMAPIGSSYLMAYEGQGLREYNYSSMDELSETQVYVAIVNLRGEKVKLIFEPDEKILDAIKAENSSKVYIG